MGQLYIMVCFFFCIFLLEFFPLAVCLKQEEGKTKGKVKVSSTTFFHSLQKGVWIQVIFRAKFKTVCTLLVSVKFPVCKSACFGERIDFNP